MDRRGILNINWIEVMITALQSSKSNESMYNDLNSMKETTTMDIKFCELLCAKFCHDMAGHVGAINNGLDFMTSEDEATQKLAMDLVKTSSKRAIHTLTFLRQAYGYVSYETDINFYTLKTFVDNYLKDSKIDCVILKETKGDAIDGRVAKLIYNATMMISGIMMHHGSLKILLGSDDSLTLVGTAPAYKVDEDLEPIIQNPSQVTNLTARNIQVVFTARVAEDIGYKIQAEYAEPGIFTLTFKKAN